jgi:hypothetical protein
MTAIMADEQHCAATQQGRHELTCRHVLQENLPEEK